MKLQDVILKAMAKKISWLEAAEIVGVTDRTMRRMRERYRGVRVYRAVRPDGEESAASTGCRWQTAEEVLRLYQGGIFRPEHAAFSREAAGRAPIELSYTWVQKALQGAGLVAKRHKRGRTGAGVRGARCRACCCILTAASIDG